MLSPVVQVQLVLCCCFSSMLCSTYHCWCTDVATTHPHQCAASCCCSSHSAVAPAGSYLDKGIGKLCQKGTYSVGLNSEPNCQTCPAGITTAAEGSKAPAACALAMKGYYLANATTSAPCPADTFNDKEAAITECEKCPNGEWEEQPSAGKSSEGTPLHAWQ